MEGRGQAYARNRIPAVAILFLLLLEIFMLIPMSPASAINSSGGPAFSSSVARSLSGLDTVNSSSQQNETAVEASDPPSVTLLGGFEGIGQLVEGASSVPDVQVAVSPKYIVEMINRVEEVWDKSTGSPVPLPPGNNVRRGLVDLFHAADNVDPFILFDASSGRWFASVLNPQNDNGSIVLAVSDGDNPTGVCGNGWHCYYFNSPVGTEPDQPKIGLDDDMVALSANIFTQGANTKSQGAEAWFLSKADLVNGVKQVNLRGTRTEPNTLLFTLYPVRSTSATTLLYLVTILQCNADNTVCNEGSNGGNRLQVWTVKWFDRSQTTVVKSFTEVPIRPIKPPPKAVQPGNNPPLTTSDNRVRGAVWQNNLLWLASNEACTPSDDTQSRSCLRLLQLKAPANGFANNGPLTDLDVGKAGTYLFYPAVDMDRSNNLDVVYGVSSAQISPSIAVFYMAQGQSATLVDLGVVKPGAAPFSNCFVRDEACRYGDYFGATVDPANPSIGWFAGQYSTADGDYSTFIGSKTLSPTLKLDFVEVGLPANTAWYLTVNGIRKTSATDTISFVLPAGTYPWTAQNPVVVVGQGYVPTLSGGSIVLRQDTVQRITYARACQQGTTDSATACFGVAEFPAGSVFLILPVLLSLLYFIRREATRGRKSSHSFSRAHDATTATLHDAGLPSSRKQTS